MVKVKKEGKKDQIIREKKKNLGSMEANVTSLSTKTTSE